MSLHPLTRTRATVAAVVVAALLAAAAAHTAEGADAPSSRLHARALAATCAGCHGTDGRAVAGEAMVSLAGLQKDHLVAQMQAFRDGKRPASVMHQLSRGYTDEQIDAIAAYFAARQ